MTRFAVIAGVGEMADSAGIQVFCGGAYKTVDENQREGFL